MADTLLDVLHAFDAFVTFEISFPLGYARYLTQEELDAFRHIPAQPGQTVQEHRQAECAAQPTIGQCLRADDGRPRVMPPVIVVAGHPESMLDLRQGGLGGGVVGFWDWDREQIERENWFPETEGEHNLEEIPRPLSPLPEDPRSIEGYFSGSLANDMSDSAVVQQDRAPDDDAPAETGRNRRAVARSLLSLPKDERLAEIRAVSTNTVRWLAAAGHTEELVGKLEMGDDSQLAREVRADALLPWQVHELARRLYELPEYWRYWVAQQAENIDVDWAEALERGEGFAWWDNLTPFRQEIVRKVMRLEELANDAETFEIADGKLLSLQFRDLVLSAVDEMEEDLYSYMRPLIEHNEEVAVAFIGRLAGPYTYWHFAIAQIDQNGFQEGSNLHLARGCAVIKIANHKRRLRATELFERAEMWLDSVGDAERESDPGVCGFRGAFWHIHILLSQSWEELYYGMWAHLGIEEAKSMALESVISIITGGRTLQQIQREQRIGEQRIWEAVAEPTPGWGAEEPVYGQPGDPNSVRW